MYPRTSRFFSSKAALTAAVALLLCLCQTGLSRDRDAFAGAPPPPPPQPNPVQMEVPRGEAINIPLTAYSLTSQILRFRIKRPPHGGKVGTPKLTTVNGGYVRYEPPVGTGPGEDDFSYEVQSAAGVSAPADVQIKITDRDPEVMTPTDLEFGQVVPGQTARKTLTMQNVGGGLAEGEIKLPAGWTVDGEATYHLTAGQKADFTIVFNPGKAQPFTGDVEYTGNPERATDLNGEGVAPVAITPATLELTQGGAMRAGALHLENRMATPQTVKFTTGPRLQPIADSTLPANGTAEVDVVAKGDDQGELSDQIAADMGSTQTNIAVHASAVMITQLGGAAGAAGAGSAPSATPGPVVAAAQDSGGSMPGEGGGGGGNYGGMAGQGDQAARGMHLYALTVTMPTETSAALDCNFKGAPAARDYRVEIRSIGLDQGNPVAKWSALPNTPVAVNKQEVTANLTSLPAGIQHVVRIVALDAGGNVVAYSGPGVVETAFAGKRWTWQWVVLGLGVVVVGGWGWSRWRG